MPDQPKMTSYETSRECTGTKEVNINGIRLIKTEYIYMINIIQHW